MPNLEKFLKLFDTLDLKQGEYLLTGSVTLAALGIRDCADLDVLVTDSVGERLKGHYPEKFHPESFCDKLIFPDMEIMWNFRVENRPWSTEQQIAEAMTINGRTYQSLERIKFFKQQQGRPKDLEDLARIEAYENKL